MYMYFVCMHAVGPIPPGPPGSAPCVVAAYIRRTRATLPFSPAMCQGLGTVVLLPVYGMLQLPPGTFFQCTVYNTQEILVRMHACIGA